MEERSSPLISLITIYWNSSKYLSRCLDCVSRQRFKDFEIIIVDNGSSDDGLTDLEQKYPKLDLRIEHLKSNMGYAAANNLGAQLARGKWLVLLNTDAFPEPNWLEELTSASALHPEVSSFSSRQLQAHNPKILDGAGDAYHVSGFAWRIGLGYPSEQFGLEQAEIFSPCAAAAMYLRQAFLAVGGFDEDFFSYFEDVDLGFRLHLSGHRCLYVPTAVVHHVGSATLGVRSDFAFYHTHRNMVWTFFKNMPSFMFWQHLPAHLVLNLVYVLHYTLRGRGRVLLKAKRDAILGLPMALRKRRTIQGTRRISNRNLVKHMQRGLLQPYLLGVNLRKALENNKTDTS
jgi:GT2 family glycosyltransferase